jgi:hypothetical protein
MTVTTRASDELPGQSNAFPGPPRSDRAWELVSIPDSSGNPISLVGGVSDAGDRAVYGIAGGTDVGNSGAFFSIHYSERPPGAHPSEGWQPRLITPAREDLVGPNWGLELSGASDLSAFVSSNSGPSTPFNFGQGPLWRMSPTAAPELLFAPDSVNGFAMPPFGDATVYSTSADAARTVAYLIGESLDPAFPAAAPQRNIYDLSDGGAPELLSLMPDAQPSPCGVEPVAGRHEQASRWLSADGDHLYFRSQGPACDGAPPQLYARDIAAQQTELVSGPALSGPTCPARFIRSIDGAAFLSTETRLDPDDLESSSCSQGRDVYRYTLADGSLDCLTCLVPGVATNVTEAGFTEAGSLSFSIADDGSRLYFRASTPLLPGGAGVYRLNLENGDPGLDDLALIPGLAIGETQFDVNLSPDGRYLAFVSVPNQAATLTPLGGLSDNGGDAQFYLYDDADGSITCVSCPLDGSAPIDAAGGNLAGWGDAHGQPGQRALADDGTFAFSTASTLVAADTNAAGGCPRIDDGFSCADVYEWRDGRPLLITDGATDWLFTPRVSGITPSGHDIFFDGPVAYTPDALDRNRRLYDARIGGGIDFPLPLPPCDLNSGACEGAGTSAPNFPGSGAAVFQGPGNSGGQMQPRKPRCPKGKRKVVRKGRVRCVAKKRKGKRNARNERRAVR